MNAPDSPVVPDPVSGRPKDRQVREMFSRIAPTYDFLNRFLSMGVDQSWRRYAVRKLKATAPARVLDLCGGTGDFGLQLLKVRPEDTVFNTDFCYPMLEKARDRLGAKGARHGVLCGDALNLPLPSDSMDLGLCAFGVRNWADLDRGLEETRRVLRPGGEFGVLEFFQCQRPGLSDRLGRLYVNRILPTLGGIVSGDRGAYQYLADSMEGFCSVEGFRERAEDSGFEIALEKRFFLGLCHFLVLRNPR